jgi:HipA-like protein
MRQAEILFKNELAGTLTQLDDVTFSFTYTENWIKNDAKRAISLTLPKSKKEFKSKHLFAFFYNMLPEGSNKDQVCKNIRIDKDDYFGILMSTAAFDTIGAIRIKKIV